MTETIFFLNFTIISNVPLDLFFKVDLDFDISRHPKLGLTGISLVFAFIEGNFNVC